jgi:hypothetical protein
MQIIAGSDRENLEKEKKAATRREENREYIGVREWTAAAFDFPTAWDVPDHCVTMELLQYPVNYGWGPITVPVSRTRASSHVLSGGYGDTTYLILCGSFLTFYL